MPTDQNDPHCPPPAPGAERQYLRDLKAIEAMEEARRYELEIWFPFEQGGVDEEDGPCLRSG